MPRTQEHAQWFTNERSKANTVACRTCGVGVGQTCVNLLTGQESDHKPACATRILDAAAVNG